MENKKFQSSFNPTKTSQNLFKNGRIAASNETPADVITRVTNAIVEVENSFNTSQEEKEVFAKQIGSLLDDGKIVLSTPILTNAGRYKNKPLSACALAPINSKTTRNETIQIISNYHIDGMGTGFPLDEFDNPAQRLKELNAIAVENANTGLEDRPVGNMATCSIEHPAIKDFIIAKMNAENEDWKFNISLNVSSKFMENVKKREEYMQESGHIVDPFNVLEQTAKAAHLCSDPGLIFIDRVRESNPEKSNGEYLTVAPCGEVGLVFGETCHFGYLNLGKFTLNDENEPTIDFEGLKEATFALTRILDNALEISLSNYTNPATLKTTSQRRKIGVGVCGFADLLFKLGVPYDSSTASEIAMDIMSLINYSSKLASHKLAISRGSFLAYDDPTCKYNDESFINSRFARTTHTVTKEQWQELSKTIKHTRKLRNLNTTALPPTGRSALLYDASTSIEPVFSLYSSSIIHPELNNQLIKNKLNDSHTIEHIKKTGSIRDLNSIPLRLKAVFKTALEIPISSHIEICSAFQSFTDEAISKTVNLPASASAEQVLSVFIQAYDAGLKGITVYRAESRKKQPVRLAALASKI